MISQTFLNSPEYKQFKQFLLDERVNKPIKLKTEGKTNEMIAREATSFEIASKMIIKTIKKFERQALKDRTTTTESWK